MRQFPGSWELLASQEKRSATGLERNLARNRTALVCVSVCAVQCVCLTFVHVSCMPGLTLVPPPRGAVPASINPDSAPPSPPCRRAGIEAGLCLPSAAAGPKSNTFKPDAGAHSTSLHQNLVHTGANNAILFQSGQSGRWARDYGVIFPCDAEALPFPSCCRYTKATQDKQLRSWPFDQL